MSKKKPGKPETLGICVYCGQSGRVEPDHVVPCTLFLHGNQSKWTVPSCRSCNVRKSAGESDLRDYVVIDKDGSRHPQALRLLPLIEKAAVKGFSRIALAVMDAEDKPLITPAGIYLGHFPTTTIDDGPMLRSLEMMVRGLYFLEMKRILPVNCPVEVKRVDRYRSPEIANRMAKLPHRGPHALRDDIFWRLSVHTEDVLGNPDDLAQVADVSIWLLCFFDQVLFFGQTGSRAPHKDKQVPVEDLVGPNRLTLRT